MNESAKKLLRQLSGKKKGKGVGIFLAILGLLPAVMGVSMIAENAGLEPVRYSPSLPEGTYCYIDAELVTESYAAMTNYGISTNEYCLVCDEDYSWVAAGVTVSRYKEFAPLIEYTYSEDENEPSPGSVRISGTLMDMESELDDYTDEYARYLFGDEASIVRSGLYIKDGMNDDLFGGIVCCGLGALLVGSGIITVTGSGKNGRKAKKTVAGLEKEGKLGDVLAEYEAEGSIRLNSTPAHTDCILGENYIFLFNGGKIMTYGDINCLSIQAAGNGQLASSRVLNVHDSFGTVYPIVAEPLSRADSEDSVVAKCIALIQSRNPAARII